MTFDKKLNEALSRVFESVSKPSTPGNVSGHMTEVGSDEYVGGADAASREPSRGTIKTKKYKGSNPGVPHKYGTFDRDNM